ncbi:MAG: beta-lactamase family protein [Cyclobacteriaceae bacterium]|nr:beta-lactamase family protein [Cyclobacteriaceae bacterium]
MYHLVYALLLILSAFSCLQKTDKQVSDQRSHTIHRFIQNFHISGSFDGSALVADSSGIIYKGAFGLANREKRIPLNPGSLFYLASVSKQFTATAILMLVQEGKTTLTDKIIKHLPELPAIYQEITIRNLLNHTSGIPDYYEFLEPSEGFTNQDVLEVLMQIDNLEFAPGDRYRYSNSGYVLLSVLVSRISGTSFTEFLNEHAFRKAGLQQTIVFDENAGPLENRVVGYAPDSTITDYRYRTTGGGGIFSNAEDLYRWHMALSSGKILEPEIQKLAFEPTILNNDSIIYYGSGWKIDPSDPNHVFHDGSLEGFRTFFDRYLDQGIVIILLSNNSSEKLEELAEGIYGIID